MSHFQLLLERTCCARQQFIEIPLIQETLRRGAPMNVYLDFLTQAYHHVKHTAPLMGLAASRCGPGDRIYQSELFDYLAEERGHEEWILDDINALGGDSEAVRGGSPRFPCKIMVGHAYYLIEHISPYGLLGMIHVLEGISVTLAAKAVTAIRRSLQIASQNGFKYLTTHGELDADHTKRFERLLNGIQPRYLPLIMECTSDFYKLYGDIFRDIDSRHKAHVVAA
jgi:Iron-containing redox enzyme